MNMCMTEHKAKIEGAVECVRGYLADVGGPIVTREKAITMAFDVIRKSEKLDSADIAEVLRACIRRGVLTSVEACEA